MSLSVLEFLPQVRYEQIILFQVEIPGNIMSTNPYQ
jgi:hypothetical protein